MDLNLAKSLVSKKFCIQGNLDPMSLVVGGNQLKNEVNRILSVMKNNS